MLPSSRRYAFTLVEVLIVVAVIAVLIALLLPAVQHLRETSNRSRCQNNLKQLALAIHGYHNERGGLPMFVGEGGSACCYGTWQVLVLPYLEQEALARGYEKWGEQSAPFEVSWYAAPNNRTATTGHRLTDLTCASDSPNMSKIDGVTSHNYVVNLGNTALSDTVGTQTLLTVPDEPGLKFRGAPFRRGRSIRLDEIGDGTATTLLASEVVQGHRRDVRGLTWWGPAAGFTTQLPPNSSMPDRPYYAAPFCDPAPPNPPCVLNTPAAPVRFAARSRHPGGVNAAHADGAVTWFPNSTRLQVWRALSTSQGGESDLSD
jgi:prepilin-type N-terminal cleavage/methylation domain-containing protein/prepilin-type processing-associated H-X9-DG protein